MQPINVTVLSLLLARACGMDHDSLREIGVGALLHDIGKLELPDRLRWRDPKFSAAERRLYEDHVAKGSLLSDRMGLSAPVRTIIEQHRELDDGSGYPAGLRGEMLAPTARIVALVNYYDNLCNPGDSARALPPHDALAVMFAKMRSQFDTSTMATFIRMMGVYPPGSVIQLPDSRYAISIAVNAARPIRPRVIVYNPDGCPEDALILDLEAMPEVGVRHSLKPTQLPRAAFDYLSPRSYVGYFLEHPVESREPRVAAS